MTCDSRAQQHRPEVSRRVGVFPPRLRGRRAGPDFAITSSSQWHEKLGSGKSLFYYDNMTFALKISVSSSMRVVPSAVGPLNRPIP